MLGTCAAEGWPALFCSCGACRRARLLGGKNLRSRCSIQIDGILKIDIPPDTLLHTHRYNLELFKLEYLLITHSHGDHLSAGEILYIMPPFADPPVVEKLKIFANKESLEIIKNAIKDNPFSTSYGPMIEISSFQTLSLSPYTVTTLKAIHGSDEHSINYTIERDGRSLPYACDTGFYSPETWEFLCGRRLDMVISECTEGPNRADYKTHMGFPNILDFRKKAEEIGLCDQKTQWILTHFSHGGGLLHDELVALVGPEGFQVAWDGMNLEL